MTTRNPRRKFSSERNILTLFFGLLCSDIEGEAGDVITAFGYNANFV